MTPAAIPLFDLFDRRLAWLGARQGVLSQNVANADTPGYVARDLAPFASALQGHVLAAVTTDPGHLGGAAASPLSRAAQGERAPDGNGVQLDEQLMRIADTDTAHELAADLYRRYLGMVRTAIGK